jgi:hypothetical protein
MVLQCACVSILQAEKENGNADFASILGQAHLLSKMQQQCKRENWLASRCENTGKIRRCKIRPQILTMYP